MDEKDIILKMIKFRKDMLQTQLDIINKHIESKLDYTKLDTEARLDELECLYDVISKGV